MSIPAPPGPSAEGFALWHADRDSAAAFFDVVEEYYESGRNGMVAISVSRGDGRVGYVEVNATAPTQSYACRIDGVLVEHIDALVRCLRDYPYVFVAAGFTTEAGQDHLLPRCKYATTAVLVDGVIINGTSGEFPYPQLDW
jgi:hypothetical protein